jgi:hypothetical protein
MKIQEKQLCVFEYFIIFVLVLVGFKVCQTATEEVADRREKNYFILGKPET